MTKRNFQVFALGILFSVTVVSVFYYFNFDSEKEKSLSKAKEILEEEEYVILSKSEFHSLQDKIQNTEKSPSINGENKEMSNVEQQTTAFETDPMQTTIIHYQLEVVSGMTSNEIAKILADKNIIKDETSFAQFLINHGYQTKIQLGSYPLTNNMSYEQIVKLITD